MEPHSRDWVVDVDSHVYEPAVIWDDYVEPSLRERARDGFWHYVDEAGNPVTIVNGARAPELNRSRIVRQAIWRPGMTPAAIGALDPDVPQQANPGAWDPAVRLIDMDAMHVAQQIVFPTLFAEYLPMVADPDVAHVLARAYNDWVLDFASLAPDRLHPVAVLPWQDVSSALEELDRVAALGFGAVLVRPMFQPGSAAGTAEERVLALAQSGTPGILGIVPNAQGEFVEHPVFRPLWARMAERALVACVHPSLGIANAEPTSAGSFLERVSARLGIGHSVAEAVAYQQDNGVFLTAAAFHGLLEDYPTLRLALLHSGASWVPLALEKSETYLWVSVICTPAPVSLEPERVFDAHPTLVSFDSWEEAIGRIPEVFVGYAAWGSRYPHHDAADPTEALAMLDRGGVDDETVHALMAGNAARLFDLKPPGGL
ncbi:MAG TPA: amidohydrolase family protein [Acidimicrobiia bacterium]|nr:amidohydrolase family protein [Acidimicrobiia bacterium]